MPATKPPRKSAPPAAPRGRGRPRQARPTRPRAAPHKLTDAELIARAISVSKAADGTPITDRDFAERILLCHPRTLRKYLQEGRTLPALAREKLVELVRESAAVARPDGSPK